MNCLRQKGCSLVPGVEHSLRSHVPQQLQSQSQSHALMLDDVPQPEAPDAGATDSAGNWPDLADARQLVRLIQCPRCSRPLDAPVTLPCSHTVCRTCLPAPQPRANISYPNTPDRLIGIACPLLGCGAEHAAAECSVDVTLAKLMDLVKDAVAQHRPPPSEDDSPLQLQEILAQFSAGDEKEGPLSEKGHELVLHGGRLVATFTMAEMGQLHYTSELSYQTLSPTGDEYRQLDTTLLERLRSETVEELECLVCYNIMVDPITTTCGHTFCRRCLVRVIDHAPICPFCRRNLHVPASLDGQCGNALLNSLLNGLCSDLVTARAAAIGAEEQVGIDTLDTPLFICTLVLPSMPTFLHVFEPRYRLMIRRVMDSGGQFGMMMYNRTGAPQGELGAVNFLEYGSMLQVVNYELLEDGRSVLEARGIGRFRVKAHGMLDGYNVGSIERIEDVSLAEEGILEQRETSMARDFAQVILDQQPNQPLPAGIAVKVMSTLELLDRCLEFIREMRVASAPWLRDRIIQVYGEPPEDIAMFPYWFATVVPVVEEEKYALLRITQVRERLKLVYSWIERIRGQTQSTGNSCAIL